jgi:hypothetical protein
MEGLSPKSNLTRTADRSRNGAQRRRLTGAVGAKDGDDLPLFDPQIYLVKNPATTIFRRNSIELKK